MLICRSMIQTLGKSTIAFRVKNFLQIGISHIDIFINWDHDKI